jgi:cytochrome c-type biogenesis protein CcmH/NrfF
LRRSVAAFVLLALVPPALAATEREIHEHYLEAATTILCDCGCHPQSVHDCACGRAGTMRGDVERMARSGMTGQEIIDDYVAKYGEQIRIAPTASGFNLVAWLGPSLGLVAMSAILLLVLRRWRRRPDEMPVSASAPSVRDPRAAARLRAAMEEWD